jgi:hypothetical protein
MTATDAILAALRKRYRFSEGEVPHDAGDMVYEAGKDHEALLYSLLFVPEFSIVDDSVLLNYADIDTERRFLEAKKAGRMSLESLEVSFNHVEVEFLFAKGSLDSNEERLLAERIAAAWRGALAVFCPDRHMVVRIPPPEDYAGNTVVEFFERR